MNKTVVSWYFRKISRKDSERLLLLQGNCRGTFLIRESETTSGDFALSVRDLDPKSISTNDRVVHYRVKPITNSHQVCITTKQPFANLSDLIDHYSRESDGLACQLTRPCPRPPPPVKDLSRLTRDHWAIERSSIELVSQLGAGQFGEVWKGLWNGTIEVAVKTLKPGSMTRTEFLKEAKIMKQLQHRHLVRLYAVVTDEPIYIVTELMQHGSLLDYLRSPSGQQLTLANLTDMMTQIADGMSVLEEKGLVHRDLATRNILVGGSDEDGLLVKIADFGLARILDIYNEAYTAKEGAKFPIKWTAPEAAAFGRFTVKSDVWSYGVVMFELVTYGQLPFAGMGNCETLEQIDRGYRMPQPLGCPNHLYTIMLQTWDVDPEQRPSFTELAHYFDQLSDAHSSRVGEHMTAPVDIVNRRRSSSSNCDNFKRRLLNRSSMIAAMPVAT